MLSSLEMHRDNKTWPAPRECGAGFLFANFGKKHTIRWHKYKIPINLTIMKSLPQKLLERLEIIYSKEWTQKILDWFSAERICSFRVNALKSDKTEIEEYLNSNYIPFELATFSELTYLIDKKYEYALKWSDIFYSGKIYVQWISSQIPPLVLNPQKWEKILDVTAAPWSKTTQMAAMIWNDWKIIACEKNQIRFDKLNYNLRLQWAACVESIKADALNIWEIFIEGFFDKILLDAPCSAEWRIDPNNEKTFGFWTLENIKKKQELQLELLAKSIPLLKKWWTLVYSTCTLAPEENEEVVDKVLKKYFDMVIEEIDINIPNSMPWITSFSEKQYSSELTKTIRINPSNLSEWFFIAKLKKSI